MRHETRAAAAEPLASGAGPRRWTPAGTLGVDTALLELGVLVRDTLQRSLPAIVAGEQALCEQVVQGGAEIGRRYQGLELGVLALIARPQSASADLRRLATILQIAMHLERIGDAAVTLARLGRLAPTSRLPAMVGEPLGEMGCLVVKLTGLGVRAFANRDLVLCMALDDIDDRLHQLNRRVLALVRGLDQTEQECAWGALVYDAARELERAGGHAVDIGEHVRTVIAG